MGELRELWQWGFELDGARHPWGTHASDVAVTSVRGGEQHGLPMLARSLHAVRVGPITYLHCQLAAEARLYEDATLAALRARLDADLGPGEHVPSEHGPEKANSRWRLDGASVRLTAFPSAWGFNEGRSSGRLEVWADRERIVQPFLPAWHGEGEPWMHDPGELELIPASLLRDFRNPPWKRDEITLALSRPELRATPDWVGRHLQPDLVAIWHHPASGTRGLAIPAFTLPWPAADPPALKHIRWSPVRGGGLAEIGVAGGENLVVTLPGPAGLDAVAARLVELGVPIETVEEEDWG